MSYNTWASRWVYTEKYKVLVLRPCPLTSSWSLLPYAWGGLQWIPCTFHTFKKTLLTKSPHYCQCWKVDFPLPTALTISMPSHTTDQWSILCRRADICRGPKSWVTSMARHIYVKEDGHQQAQWTRYDRTHNVQCMYIQTASYSRF